MKPHEVKLEGFGAAFSDDRLYRYALWRVWNPDKGLVMFIGLNPSTANETKPDPTITRVMGFAGRWGYGGVIMMNLFALVSSKPQALITCPDSVGENNLWLQTMAGKSQKVIFAWGAFKQAKSRCQQVIKMFPDAECLLKTADGSPGHPLYVAGITVPIKIS